jgi:adenylate cyclase class 1
MESEQILKYFKAHNRSRIERLVGLAPNTKKSFFQLLPLIFQSNSAELPCFVENAPFGIVDYQPSSSLLANTKKQTPKFSYTPHPLPFYPIQGIYLINDAGSLNFPEKPNYDLWIVYSSAIDSEQTELLKQKLQAVLSWAKSLGIHLKARLLNDTAVAEHKIEDDDLDRFYSSGMIMAGSLPLWWLVAPEKMSDYAQAATLITQDASIKDSLLDFGPLKQRSAETLVSSAALACKNAMTHGLPDFVELLYQLSLINQFSNNLWLSDSYKNKVYNQENNTFLCDPAIIKFQLVTSSTTADIQQYLRQSIYIQSQERLSINVRNPEQPWRRESITDLVNSWHWQPKDLKRLDHRNQARIRTRLEEFHLTEKYTGQFLVKLKDFTKQYANMSAKQVVAVDKQYKDIFDCAPDVIPCLPHSLVPDESEDHLALELDTNDDHWTLNEVEKAAVPKDETFSPLHKDKSLIRILAWSILNGALSGYTRIKLNSNNSSVSIESVSTIIKYLMESALAETKPASSNKVNWLMFANTLQTPKEAYKQQDMKLSIQLRDPLNYGHHRRNIVLTLEVLASTNFRDWHYLSFQGTSAVSEALSSMLRWHSDTNSNTAINCWCPTPNFAPSIIERLTTLSNHLVAHYKKSPDRGTYILEVSDRLLRTQWQSSNIDATFIASKYDLNTLLSQPRTQLTTTKVDDHLDRTGLYDLLLNQQDQKQLQCFISTHKSTVTIYVIDEVGGLYKQRLANLRESTVANHFNEFLHHLAQKSGLSPPHLYKLTQNDMGNWQKDILDLGIQNSNSPLTIDVELTDAKFDGECTFIINGKKMSGPAKDAQFYKQAKQVIAQHRSAQANYPVYLSSISFTGDDVYRTGQYILIKQKFEKLLNANW